MTTSARSVALTIGFIASVSSFTILAHEAGDLDTNYVGDGSKHLITDSSGNCVRTGTGSKDAVCDEVVVKAPEPAPVAEPVAMPEPAPVVPEVITRKLTLSAGATFATNKATLKPLAKTRLDQLAADLPTIDTITEISVIGHTDSMGAESYNQTLSEKRANTVRDYLIEQGVDPSLINASGMGESQPIASNATRDGRAENRRVDITITGTRTE